VRPKALESATNVVEVRKALSALDHGEKGNADTGLCGELFLRE